MDGKEKTRCLKRKKPNAHQGQDPHNTRTLSPVFSLFLPAIYAVMDLFSRSAVISSTVLSRILTAP